MEIRFLEGEAWYGLLVQKGLTMPLCADSDVTLSTEPHTTCNQCNPVLLSNKGRFLYAEEGMTVTAKDGVLSVSSKRCEPVLREGFTDLRGACLAAAKEFYPASGELPPHEFITAPQFNTWAEFGIMQTEKGITEYAENLVREGIKPGVLMIDDLWANYYGNWEFDLRKFPHPKECMAHLAGLGFKVMLWICPFVSPDSPEYRDLLKKDLLIKEPDGKTPYICKWWNGHSAVLDLTNPEAMAWFKGKCDVLVKEYGVSGFKFDAGDTYFYRDEDVTHAPTTPCDEARLWASLGYDYPYNEFRAGYRNAGTRIVQRLQDKRHSWNRQDGFGEIIPDMLCQGLIGYAFGAPDMVGGGCASDFVGKKDLDYELIVRYCEAATLMPMIQFSAAPWRVLDEKSYGIVKQCLALREKYMDKIMALAENAAKTGEPIIRYLEYVFPGEGFERITDRFMLGDDTLVCPVQNKGEFEKEVRLPGGTWRYEPTGEVYDGGKTVTVPSPVEVLPVFTKIG